MWVCVPSDTFCEHKVSAGVCLQVGHWKTMQMETISPVAATIEINKQKPGRHQHHSLPQDKFQGSFEFALH